MSIGAMGGLTGSAAGAPLAQTRGSEAERAQESAQQDRQVQADLKSETAAGIGATDGEDQQAEERDADGRRLWEAPPGKPKPPAPADDQPSADRHGRDPSGQCGNTLDISG